MRTALLKSLGDNTLKIDALFQHYTMDASNTSKQNWVSYIEDTLRSIELNGAPLDIADIILNALDRDRQEVMESSPKTRFN